MFVSLGTKGEPQGDRGAGNKARPPESHIVTAQSCSSAPAMFLAAHSLHPSCSWGAAPLALCIFRCPMGLWGPPKSHSVGTEPTQLLEEVGLHRVRGCSGRGAYTGGGMTLERS